MMFRYSESRSFFSSGTCSDSIRPLRAYTVNFSRTDLSILMVIDVIAMLCIASSPANGRKQVCNPETNCNPLKNRRPETSFDDEISSSAEFSGGGKVGLITNQKQTCTSLIFS